MGRAARKGGRRGNSGRAAAGIPQLPWRQARNTYPPYAIVTEAELDLIHDTSIRILSEAGIRVMSVRALDLFEAAGALVDRDTMTIRIDAGIVDAALATAPVRFDMVARNPEKRIEMGGNAINFGLVAGPPNIHDAIGGRRDGNLTDYRNFIKLAHHFNVVNIIGNQVCAPMELPANTRHLDTYLANLTCCDLTFHATAIGRGRAMDAINMMAISRGISPEEMARTPGVTTIISVNSPRLLDEAMTDGLIAMAEHGQPVSITPFTLMGAMTPVTLPAAMAQQNAEALFGVVLTQLVAPGTPVLYGAFTSNVDMRSGAPAFGTPENTKANIVAGQLARRYGLPYRTSNANAANVVDLQATYETMMSSWGAILGGANLVYHAAGWLEGGLTASYEKFILDVEIIQNMVEFLRPLDVSEEELGLDAIKAVPTGGHFFGSEHTIARYETAFYRPMLSDWTNYEGWLADGGTDALTRATALLADGPGGIRGARDGPGDRRGARRLRGPPPGGNRQRRAVNYGAAELTRANAPPTDISVLLLDGFSLLSLVSLLETARIANRLAGREVLNCRRASETGAPVMSSLGLEIPVDEGMVVPRPGAILLVCGGTDVVSRTSDRTLSWVRRCASHGVSLGGLCTGGYVLARAGVLRGRTITVHWEHHDGMREDFPDVNVSLAPYAIDGPILSAAGGTSAIDLALELIERDHGSVLAMETARQICYLDLHELQSTTRDAPVERSPVRNPRLKRVLREMEQSVETPQPISHFAAEAGVSIRQLERLFSAHLGATPVHYFMRLRLDRALRLLIQTEMPIMDVALATGFGSQASFSRKFRQHFGRSPSGLRQ